MTEEARKLIAEAREKAAKATKGPWEREPGGKGDSFYQSILDANERTVCDSLNSDSVVLEYDAEDGYTSDVGSVDNFDFIAAARTLVPALADLAEKQAAVVEAAYGVVDHWGSVFPVGKPHWTSTASSIEGDLLRAALKALEEK